MLPGDLIFKQVKIWIYICDTFLDQIFVNNMKNDPVTLFEVKIGQK